MSRRTRSSELGPLLARVGGDDAPADAGRITWITDDPEEVDGETVFVFHAETPRVEVAAGLAAGPRAVVASEAVGAHRRSVVVDDSRVALDVLCRHHFEAPDSGLRLVGVTGTNGKGTTAHLIAGGLAATGREVLVIGSFDGPPTTPRTATAYSLLRAAADDGVDDVVVELSSHGIMERRFGECRFRLVVLTNLGRDHEDSHGGLARYHEVKASALRSDRVDEVIVPRPLLDHPALQGIDPVVVSAVDGLRDIRSGSASVEFTWRGERIGLPMTGHHNVENASAAVAVLSVLGVGPAAIRTGWSALAPLPGRFETVSSGDGRRWIVDFAHNADALRAALETAAAMGPRVVLVLGSDPTIEPARRHALGVVAAALADLTILTEEVPPSPSVRGVAGEIATAFADTDAVEVVADRRAALDAARSAARAGDVILVAGRGERPGPANERGESYPSDREMIVDLSSP